MTTPNAQPEAELEREQILGENDPEAYEQAADRVTADADRDVWVVERKVGDEWRVTAVFTSYRDAEAFTQDYRDFAENCPEDTPSKYARKTVSFRLGGRKSPKSLYESWPPENGGETS